MEATVKDLITNLTEGQETLLTLSGDGTSTSPRVVAFSLRTLPADEPKPPTKAESQARAHAFIEAASFAGYLERYGVEGDIVVWADPERESAWGVLAEKAPNGREIVTFKPQLHPLWRPWAELIARGRMTLEAFRDFLSQHKRAVRTPDGRTLALQLAQIRAAVEVTIHDGKGRNALNGIVVKSNVQGTDTKEIVDLPEELVLHVPLYVGMEPQDVMLDLVLDATPNGAVTVLVAAGGVAEARVLAFDAMLGKIHEILNAKDAKIGYGQPNGRDWTYLDA